MGLNINKIQEQKERGAVGGAWRPKEGHNDVRVLPPCSEYFDEDIDYYCLDFNMHFMRQEGYNMEVTRCLRDAADYCPVCDMAAQFKESDDPALMQTAKDISRTQRFLMNIFDCDDQEAGVQPYTAGWTIYNGILEYLANPKWGDILDPSDGHNMDINLTPAAKARSGWNTYAVSPDPERTDVTEMLPEDWMEQLDRLPAAIPEYKKSSALVRILQRLGFPLESDEDDEDEGDQDQGEDTPDPTEEVKVKPKKPKRAVPKKAAPKRAAPKKAKRETSDDEEEEG